MEEAERRQLLSEVHSLLQSQLLACDVLVSLLYVAATSLRHDSLLKPFPASIPLGADGHRDIAQLVIPPPSLPGQLPKNVITFTGV